MPDFTRSLFVAASLLLLASARSSGEESAVTVTGANGSSIRFTESAVGTWTWTGLIVPGSTAESWTIADPGSALSVDGVEHVLSPHWTLIERNADGAAFEQDVEGANIAVRRVFSFGNAHPVVRVETWVRSLDGEKVLNAVDVLTIDVAGETFRETGDTPASFPLFGQSLFVGLEHVSGDCRANGNSARLRQMPHLNFSGPWQFVAAAVVGWTSPSDCTLVTGENRIREAFIRYLDTIRVKPADLELHTNTWWSLPVPFSEEDVLRHIASLHQGLARTGMFFDSFALDLGWSDPRSIWDVDAARFPNGFRVIDDRLRALGSRLGIWASPGSAYPPGLDNTWLRTAGYEVTPFGEPDSDLPHVACFALGGRYQREFKENLLRHVTTYGIRHVKLDFMAPTCDVAEHGHATGFDSTHAIHAGLADVLDSLRAVNPDIVLEPLCTGYPPSPWWTTKTPYVLGPHGDDVPYGRVPSPEWSESLITARDIAYRMDQERWIMPTQAIETFDIVMQAPGNFENLAVMAIGRGRWFISTYLKPELMTPANWDFLAALVRWARANKEYLANAQSIGGNPAKREAYGYMFHNKAKDIYCVRNPWIGKRVIELPVCGSITEPREIRMIYPRRETVALIEPGDKNPRLTLGPYETVMLESVPAAKNSGLLAQRSRARARAAADATPSVQHNYVAVESRDDELIAARLHWSGAVSIAEANGAELCIVVKHGADVQNADCQVTVAGWPTAVRTTGSAGQFGAAAEPSPENWKWFITPMSAGTQMVQIAVDMPSENASVGIFLRGVTKAHNDVALKKFGAVFPVSTAKERGWSRTLLPFRKHRVSGPQKSVPPAAPTLDGVE